MSGAVADGPFGELTIVCTSTKAAKDVIFLAVYTLGSLPSPKYLSVLVLVLVLVHFLPSGIVWMGCTRVAEQLIYWQCGCVGKGKDWSSKKRVHRSAHEMNLPNKHLRFGRHTGQSLILGVQTRDPPRCPPPSSPPPPCVCTRFC